MRIWGTKNLMIEMTTEEFENFKSQFNIKMRELKDTKRVLIINTWELSLINQELIEKFTGEFIDNIENIIIFEI